MATKIQYCCIFLLLSLSASTILVVEADGMLAQAECHNANVPATCMECLNSDHRSGTANPAGIANIVISCISSQAGSLAEDMSLLGASAHDKAAIEAFMRCSQLLGNAKKELVAGDQKIDKGDFNGADCSLYNAFKCSLDCHTVIDEAKKECTIDIPTKVETEMKAHEDLCEAAMRILDRLK